MNKKKDTYKQTNYVIEMKETLTSEEENLIQKLKEEIFGDMVDEKEVFEDFINIPYAYLLLKVNNKIVGNLDLHRSIGRYEEKDVSIGGLSIGILEKYRKRGYGGMLITRAMQHLKSQSYDLGFLAAAPGTVLLYEKYGWEVLNVSYQWKNIHGDIKSDTDGMIIPFKNHPLVDRIQKGSKPIYVGKGYW
jgi:predicted acetyltransferase